MIGSSSSNQSSASHSNRTLPATAPESYSRAADFQCPFGLRQRKQVARSRTAVPGRGSRHSDLHADVAQGHVILWVVGDLPNVMGRRSYQIRVSRRHSLVLAVGRRSMRPRCAHHLGIVPVRIFVTRGSAVLRCGLWRTQSWVTLPIRLSSGFDRCNSIRMRAIGDSSSGRPTVSTSSSAELAKRRKEAAMRSTGTCKSLCRKHYFQKAFMGGAYMSLSVSGGRVPA